MSTADLHSKLIDLTAVAQMLARELGNRTVPADEQDGPDCTAVCEHLAEQLAGLRDQAEHLAR